MLITEEEAILRLTSKKNVVNIIRSKMSNNPNGHGGPTISPAVRSLIAAISTADPNKKAVANAFGICSGSQANLKAGRPDYRWDTKFEPDPEIVEAIGKTKANIHRKALTNLLQSMNIIAPKIEDADGDISAKDMSQIAVNLSKVVKNMEGEGERRDRLELHLYAPNTKKESDYEIAEGEVIYSGD